MGVDPELVASLTAAVRSAPDDHPLRLHLVAALIQADRYDDALHHCAFILERVPNHHGALSAAARAAEAAGYQERADAYRRLASIGGDARPVSDAPVTDGAREVPGSDSDEVVRLSTGDIGNGETNLGEVERSFVTLADVGGMENVKKRLEVAFLMPLRNPELRQLYGKSLRGGLLLYGPPGCGKTFIARAVAGELAANFYAVGLSDVLDMFLGESERKLHEMFETARRNTPCVLFLDEIDALGQKRTHLRHSAGRNVVNQLLAELDGAERSNEGVFVLAATNHPWDVDTALRRPGRLDRMLVVLPPDEPARVAILNYHLRERPAEAVDITWVAAKTEGFSGADLAHLCESASEVALEDSVSSGRVRGIATADFKKVLKEVGPSTKAWFDLARNYALFANEGGTYDDLIAYLERRR